MARQAPDALGVFFSVLVTAMVVLVAAGAGRAVRRTRGRGAGAATAATLAVLAAWLAVTAVLARRGFFLAFDRLPPRILLAVVPPVAVLLYLACSRASDRLVAAIPPAWLIYPQAFRIVVEFVLWRLVTTGVAPEIMTFHGRNFDILVGLSAPVIAYFCFTRRLWPTQVALWWNVAGILILLNTVIHAQLAAPTPFQVFHTQPPNVFIAYYPYIWLPAFLVPLAWLLHALSIRQLLARRTTAAGA
ncbi:MAG TPA: hypothetical protein VFN71_02275 [Methylomirabilota bacterium]|nr:hypothetical protein [Methylomirabilota bacterium]